jgi:cephalosporin hydroxylase
VSLKALAPAVQRVGRRLRDRWVIDEFNRIYYDRNYVGGTWRDTYWMGVLTWKCPLDLWMYQEIICEQRPDVIIETGTAFGGSALFLASICDLIGTGRVLSIDVDDVPGKPTHERITYLLGSSTAEEILTQVRGMLWEGATVLIILDSDHRKTHVLEELHCYSSFVRESGYIIVEDTNVNGHPILPDFGPGPMEAVDEFLRESRDFIIDSRGDKFLLTFNPRGYLRRVR